MANKKITDVDVVSTVSDADYLFVNQGQSIKQIKKSDIPKPIYTASEVGALSVGTKIPSKTSDLQNDSGFLTEHQDLSGYALKSEVPKSASDVGAEASGTAESKVSEHNISDTAHNDIRLLIDGLTTRLNALADSDDTTLDQMSEVVAYIKSNKSLIDAITTSKINVSDIIDNLTTNVSNKPLSAAQGVALKAMIDGITIPEKLPNPQKLTFAGAVTAEYDGSGAVTVTIPEGSGGSGGSVESEEWELINTITVSDDKTNSVTISADASGNEFSLKKIYVYATGVEPKMTYFTFKINGLPWQEQFATGTLQQNNLSSINPLRFLWEKINDRVFRYICNGGVGIRAVGEITPNNGKQSNIETVNSIRMAWGINECIDNGAVFQLWGIRA